MFDEIYRADVAFAGICSFQPWTSWSIGFIWSPFFGPYLVCVCQFPFALLASPFPIFLSNPATHFSCRSQGRCSWTHSWARLHQRSMHMWWNFVLFVNISPALCALWNQLSLWMWLVIWRLGGLRLRSNTDIAGRSRPSCSTGAVCRGKKKRLI